MPNPTDSSHLPAEDEAFEASDDTTSDAVSRQARGIHHRWSSGWLKRPDERSALFGFGRLLTRLFAFLAVASCIAIVAVGAIPLLVSSSDIARWTVRGWVSMKIAPISALPLLLAGASYIVLQALLRPPPWKLLKRLMLGSAFLLWGVTQLMPAGALTAELGNIVIALYVIDLGLIIRTDLRNEVVS